MISILAISILFVWWITFSLNQTGSALNSTIQPGEQIESTDPVDYSKQKVEQINEQTKSREEEINQTP